MQQELEMKCIFREISASVPLQTENRSVAEQKCIAAKLEEILPLCKLMKGGEER